MSCKKKFIDIKTQKLFRLIHCEKKLKGCYNKRSSYEDNMKIIGELVMNLKRVWRDLLNSKLSKLKRALNSL